MQTNLAISSLVINLATMSNGDNEHDKLLILKLANDPVVAPAVATKSKFTVTKWLAEKPRIFGFADPLFHVMQDFALRPAIEFLKVA